jgi:hypothetical protein
LLAVWLFTDFFVKIHKKPKHPKNFNGFSAYYISRAYLCDRVNLRREKLMRKSLFSRSLAFLLAVIVLASTIVIVPVSAASKASAEELEEIKTLLNAITYDEYLAENAQVKNGTDDITVTVADYLPDESTASAQLYTAEDLEKILRDSYTDIQQINESMTENVALKTEQHNKFNAAYIEDMVDDAVAGMEGFENVIYLPDAGYATFGFEINDPGFYNIEIDYMSTEPTSNNIEKGVMIDGAYPYKEARSIAFLGYWVDEYDTRYEDDVRDEFNMGYTSALLDKYGFLRDINNNEIKPAKAARPTWETRYVYASTGYYNEPLRFLLNEGEHTVSINGVSGSMVIRSIRIVAAEEPATYEEKLAEYEANGYISAPADSVIKVQAEYSSATSDASIYPLNDRTSAINEPQDAAIVYLNSVGGSKWQSYGQWIEWEIEVPEDGLYEIATRFKQDTMAGMYVTRKLYIDGEVPFKEAENITFNYGANWQSQAIGKTVETTTKNWLGKESVVKEIIPYQFYLEKGIHTIRVEVVLGDMAAILREVSELMTSINNYYLKILMITGTNPDKYRDYGFTSIIPDVMKGLVEGAEVLYRISAELEAVTGQKGEDSVLLDKIALILERMGSDDDEVAPNLGSLKDNIGQLGTWISSARSQPLTLDYIQIMPVDATELPEADASFLQSLWHELKSFFMSFISDYNNLGALDVNETSSDPVEVWMTAGRDQAQIIRSMLTKFTADTGYPVNLKLVAVGSLLPATLSNTGPDVSIQNAAADCINYAIRNAVLPLNEMEGFEEVKTRFAETAMIPLSLHDKTYGIPETQTFQMLFVRLDVFAELGMEIPETWEDLYGLLPVLQSNNLEAGFPVQQSGLTLLMYQRDEPMYKPAVSPEIMEKAGLNPEDAHLTEGMQINLDSNTSLDCFKQLCDLFTMYGFPVTYDLANRFRTGEMPIAVADYTAYNQLTIFAPEISGLWKITTLPGTAKYAKDEFGDYIFDDDGNKVVEEINYNAVSSVTGTMMMRGAKGDEVRAWEFMKWWTDKDPQSEYGNELVALLGASGQYATANLAALAEQPWSSEVYAALRDQFDNLAVTPEMPGGYILTRYIQFAFLAAYNENANPVEELLGYIDSINSELSRKRQEFNLPVLEDFRNVEFE